MRLIVVRHGETLYNVQERFTGQSDVPLSALGVKQTAALGKHLATETLGVIVASDLQRARATAQAIASYHNLPVEEDADLREMTFGAWEGATYAEILACDAGRVELWETDPTVHAPPGGETVIQLHRRVVRALERWRTRYSQETVLWAVHGGVIEVLLCHLLAVDLKCRWKFRHDNASITEIDVSGEGATVVRLNETAHLDELLAEDTAARSSKD